uniref:Uncharacterized protein n=1 Tax=Oryza glumipatula TaxID=40148 RepID=A0A0D9YSJ9_9ORYZ
MVRRPIRPLAQLRPSRSRPQRSKRRDGSLCTGLRSAVAELERGGGEEMERSRAAAVFGGVYIGDVRVGREQCQNVDIATVPDFWWLAEKESMSGCQVGWGGNTDFG